MLGTPIFASIIAAGLVAQAQAPETSPAAEIATVAPTDEGGAPEEKARVEALRAQAASALARSDWKAARALYGQLLEIAPHDAAAQRDAGRAAMAAGNFNDAADVLEQAHHSVGHHRDAELHYLRGEALYELGRTDEARSEHRIAELEIGAGRPQRMQSLWLARIYARRGELDRADRTYETLWPPPSQPVDVEVGLNHAEAHLLAHDWKGAAQVLRRFIDRAPDNLRARHMLAWALEAQGDLAGELAVRGPLATDDPSPASEQEYGRALERAGDYKLALTSYQLAAERAGTPDATLVQARDRMRYRLTPELAGGLVVRTDPTTTTERLFAGAAYPFGSRHLVSLLATHDNAHGGWPIASSATTAVNGTLVLGARWGGWLMLGAQGRSVTEEPSLNGMPLQSKAGLKWGGVAEGDTPIGSAVRLNLRAELENQWAEAPVAVRENGAVTGLTGNLYVFPIPSTRDLILVTGTQTRRLMLEPAANTSSRPLSSQFLGWAGFDYVVWQNPASMLRGQILDERLARPSDLVGAMVFSFRHYELYGRTDPDFESRIALLDRSRIDVATVVVRNALADGRFGFEVRGGLGYESTRRNLLSQGGIALYAIGGAASRATISYDMAQETTTGLAGRRHTGWVAYHVDI